MIQSTKSQIPNSKQITMTKFPTVLKAQAANSKQVGDPKGMSPNLFWSLDIGAWDLFEYWCLRFGISGF
jgi:hypothetical protein